MIRHWMRITVFALAALCPTMTPAQYPARPIKILVPIPPGGAPDIVARVTGQKLAESLGQQVVVENRTGSNGNIAADLVAKSPADGYTLLLAQDSLFTINPHVYAKMPFDPLIDLVPVASIASSQFILSVNPSLPVKNLNEFIEYARRAKPPLAFASGGNGSLSHLSMEILKARTGIALVHVPYKGGTPATTATVAGETPATFAGASSAGQIKAGRLRALAQTGARRSAAFSDLPSVGEFYQGFDVTAWHGLFAAAGTPEPVLARLRTEVTTVLAQPDLKEKLNAVGGMEPYAMKLEEFVALIRRDHDRFGKLIKELKISLD
jgi:tripartite-type tricarboxylate transporter receptor subunit TctC